MEERPPLERDISGLVLSKTSGGVSAEHHPSTLRAGEIGGKQTMGDGHKAQTSSLIHPALLEQAQVRRWVFGSAASFPSRAASRRQGTRRRRQCVPTVAMAIVRGSGSGG